MVIDTSALLAILQDEPERRRFTEAIDRRQADVARHAFPTVREGPTCDAHP
jgi:uncharacterized protein with PIN domain